jgi:GDP-4-dehydro-6-deoxy-D-mannose reductase
MIVPALAGLKLAITGVDGFVGRHVARLAFASGARVYGVSRAPSVEAKLGEILHSYHSADLRIEWPVDLQVDAVIHLAGRAAVGPSFSDPQGYIEDNSAMVTTMCEALLRQKDLTRVVGISSGAVYAAPASNETFLNEESPLGCSSPYVVSKLLVENQLAYYATRGLSTVTVRPFNHIGPGQGPGFLLPDLLGRIRELGTANTLLAGNLATARDYTDVRDIARAYLMLAATPLLPHSLYNVATGTPITGFAMLQMICNLFNRELPEVIVDQSLVRPTDIPSIAGSAHRLREDFGWEPRFELATTVADAAS